MTRFIEAGGNQAGGSRRTGRFGDDKDPDLGKDTRFKPGQSGNPAGLRKGTKHLSTMIQEMMNDPQFIERLSQGIKEKTGIDPELDPEFQGTPMKAIITVAMIESMNPNIHPVARDKARSWVGKFGYGTKVDITSDGERITETPKIISIINARPSDDAAQSETEAS